MSEKKYDLEDRTHEFAIACRIYVSKLTKTISNIEDSKQLVRASGSVGANYIEANESLSKKDFVFRLKISRKESKEAVYWLNILNRINPELNTQTEPLIKEGKELKLIFSSIIEKYKV
jgi:four helix bundle protein